MKKRILPLLAVLLVVGVLFAQYGSYNQYSGDDNLSTILPRGQRTRNIGNQAVCVTPTDIAGWTVGYYLYQYCSCWNGCAVEGYADQFNYPGAQLRQSIDTYDPNDPTPLPWEQSWAESWETCDMLDRGITYDWIRQPAAVGCYRGG
jgi:hypothetical protein